MGDRCWVQVTVRKDREQQFLKRVGCDWDERTEDEHTVTFSFPDANYGLGQPLEQASVAGIEFYGHHTSGDSYGASDFFSNGKIDHEVCYIPTGNDGCGVVVDGSTPSERWRRMRVLEERIAIRDELIQRMHNPLYDIVRSADATAS